MSDLETAFLGSRTANYEGKIVHRTDTLTLGPVSYLYVKRAYTNSPWRQGIALDTDGTFTVGRKEYPNQIALWEDTAPPEVRLHTRSRSQSLKVYNLWDDGNGIQSWKEGAAMIVRNTPHGAAYYCNDGHLDASYDHLVFEITITPAWSKVLYIPTLTLDTPRSPLTGKTTNSPYTANDSALDSATITRCREIRRKKWIQFSSSSWHNVALQEKNRRDPFTKAAPNQMATKPG